jgi:polar amino acid transport system permease protein
MHYVWDFAILGKYSHLFWLGIGFTVLYTIGTVFLGTLIGLVVGLLSSPCPISSTTRP